MHLGSTTPEPDPHRTLVAALMSEVSPEPDAGSTAAILVRLGIAARDHLGVAGVAVSVATGHGPPVLIASTDQRSGRVDDAQHTLGEGPSLDAVAWRRPVLTTDLESDDADRWPHFRSTALDEGVRGVLTFPLHIGASVLGVLSFHLATPVPVLGERLAMAGAFAAEATQVLLDGSVASELESLMDLRADVYVAQGMVHVDAGLSLADALIRMRAHAYSFGISLNEVARQVISGDLTFESDA